MLTERLPSVNVIILLSVLSLSCLFFQPAWGDEKLPIIQGIGGEYELDSTLGKRLGSKDFLGKVVLLYFGYTNCPDICPLTTAHLNQVVSSIGKDKDKLQVVFITVDPKTDTPENLKLYLEFFNSDFIGLSGSQAEVAEVLDLFLAEAQQVNKNKLPLDIKVTGRTGHQTGYIYSHTARIYLIDQNGNTRAFYYVGSKIEHIQAGVLSLLKSDSERGGIEPKEL